LDESVRKSTAAIDRVVEASWRDGGPAAAAARELRRIQEQLDGTEYTNYSAAARKVSSIMQEKFGTTNLSELTDEQLSDTDR